MREASPTGAPWGPGARPNAPAGERKVLDGATALADRMDSAGTLAAALAHDLNGPLACVAANVLFLSEQVANLSALLPAPVREDGEVADVLRQLVEAARDAKEGVDRMRLVVRDLKTLSRPRARILVVDDEPLVGAVLERTLGEAYQLVTCTGAREALARVARGETFDLVLTDLHMPGLSGMELHAELARDHPTLAGRMVFLTGGACTEAARAFLERPGVEVVEKPFDLEVIREVIERRLPAA